LHVTDKNFHVTLRKSKLFLEKLSATEGKVPNVLTAGGGDLHVTVGRANKYFSYSFFWEIPRRLNFMCRRFGTLCSICISGVSRKEEIALVILLVHTTYENGTDRVF